MHDGVKYAMSFYFYAAIFIIYVMPCTILLNTPYSLNPLP